MNRPHLRWSDYDNSGDVLPDGYKRLKDGTIIDIEDFKEDEKMEDEELENECTDCMYHKFFKKNDDGSNEYYCPYGECVKDKEHTYKNIGGKK